MGLGRYLLVGYLDPWGRGRVECKSLNLLDGGLHELLSICLVNLQDMALKKDTSGGHHITPHTELYISSSVIQLFYPC